MRERSIYQNPVRDSDAEEAPLRRIAIFNQKKPPKEVTVNLTLTASHLLMGLPVAKSNGSQRTEEPIVYTNNLPGQKKKKERRWVKNRTTGRVHRR